VKGVAEADVKKPTEQVGRRKKQKERCKRACMRVQKKRIKIRLGGQPQVRVRRRVNIRGLNLTEAERFHRDWQAESAALTE